MHSGVASQLLRAAVPTLQGGSGWLHQIQRADASFVTNYIKSLFCSCLFTTDHACMDVGFDVSEGVARRDSAEGTGGEVEEPQSDRQVWDEHLPLPQSLLHFKAVPSINPTSQLKFFPRPGNVLFSDEFILVFVYLSPTLTHCVSLHYCCRFSMSSKVQWQGLCLAWWAFSIVLIVLFFFFLVHFEEMMWQRNWVISPLCNCTDWWWEGTQAYRPWPPQECPCHLCRNWFWQFAHIPSWFWTGISREY